MSYNKTVWADNQTPLSAQNLNKIENGIEKAHDDLTSHKADYEYQTATVVGSQIRLTRQSNTTRIPFKLHNDVTGTITISLDGGSTSKPLREFDGITDIEEVEAGLQEVVEESSFFILRPRGGGGVWLNDWSAYSTIYDLAGNNISTPATSYITVVDITGEGFLNYLRANGESSNSQNPDVRITIDGVSKILNGTTGASVLEGNLLVEPIVFKSSFKIEIYNRTGFTANLKCDYVYLLKQVKPDTKKQTLLEASQILMVKGRTSSSTIQTILNISGSGYLLGFEVSTEYNTSNADARVSMTVDGANKINSRTFASAVSGTIGIVKGPIRFNSGLILQHRISQSSNNIFSDVRAYYILD